jgi:hypothetical protein
MESIEVALINSCAEILCLSHSLTSEVACTMSKQSELGPNTMVYFAVRRAGADGTPTFTPEASPITLQEAAARLKENPGAWITPVLGDWGVLTSQQIEAALKPKSETPE